MTKTMKSTLFSSCPNSLGNATRQSGWHLRHSDSLEYPAPPLSHHWKWKEVGEKGKSYFGAFDYLCQVDISGQKDTCACILGGEGRGNFCVHFLKLLRPCGCIRLHLKIAMVCIPQLHTFFALTDSHQSCYYPSLRVRMTYLHTLKTPHTSRTTIFRNTLILTISIQI